jgi:outer membrane protein assembly factor BamB
MLVMTLAAAVPAIATDWPQFLGPNRNGTYAGPPLLETWGPSGPKIVWRKQVGQAFAGPVVIQNRVLLFHRVGNEEVLESLDAKTGAPGWRYAYPTNYRDDFGFDEGPRAVPVVADGIVYTFGAQGQLHAVDLVKGTRVWSVDTMKTFNVPKGFFGAAGSPLVEGGRVIANIGGDKAGIVAFEPKTGKVLWTATDDDASYSSGMAATIGGRRSAIFLTRDSLVGLDMTSVYHDGYLYGYHGRQEFGPSLRAVEFKTGAVKWSLDQFRAGSITLVGDRLLVIREGGEMLLAPASPQGFKPLARAQVLPGVVRPLPAIADGFVYVRNENTLVCLDLRR